MTTIKPNKDVLISIILLISILLTTIVYSAFSTKLQIGGELVVRSDDDIRITNTSVKEQIGGAYETYNNKFTKNTVSLFVTLPSNSSISYEIDITNKSDSIYTLAELNELTTMNSNLLFEIDTEQYDLYESNQVRKIAIIISNNSNEEIKDNIILEFRFKIAKSTFINGRDFNVKIKTLAGNVDATYETEDVNIQNIVRATTLNIDITDDNIISTTDSTVPIYVWYDSGIIYYYTKFTNPKMADYSDFMFSRLRKVTNIDLSTIDTSNVVNMSYMFHRCSATSLDLSNFDTSNVIYMNCMFLYSQATSINGLDKFNTSKVTNMERMFGSTSATALDLSNFNTSNVSNMVNMFDSSKAINLDLSSFDTSNVTSMSQMFYGSNATVIEGLDNFKTSNVVDMSSIFNSSKVISLDLSNFDTSNVTKMNSMFSNSELTTLKGLNKFNTSKVTTMRYMFNNTKIPNLDLNNFNTSKVTDMTRMFYGSKATNINLSSFDTNNVTDMQWMFGYSQATTLDVSSFKTNNVTKMNNMFSHTQATTIKGLDNFDTTNVTDMSYMFSWCVVETIDISSFNTNNVTNMEGMFNSNNNALTTIYASDKFVTDAVTNSNNMFFNCVKLVGGNGTKYNSTYIDKTYATIDTSDTPGYFTQKNS
mgnify:CR=1 FL=1